MTTETGPVRIFFFPFVGGGHQIPMIDTARVLASHGAKSTIIATPSNALHFQKSITREQHSGLPISIHTLPVPESADLSAFGMSAGPMTDTSALQDPLRDLLLRHPPDCIVVDIFHRWAGEFLDGLGVTRIIFTGNGFFPRSIHENIRRYVDLENLSSDHEPFVVPNLPHRIELTRSKLPNFMRNASQFTDRMKEIEDRALGTIVNSFYDLEPDYADYMRNVLGKKSWMVGPVSLCNRSAEDKTERGTLSTIDKQSCLNWLDSKGTNSVVYVSFGSMVRIPESQLREIAYGLEASNQPFIWVVGKILNRESEGEDGNANWLSDFEERVKESNKGLVIRGWGPQLLILEHDAVGGFVTHCGWNSTLEGLSAGVPMATWPISAEQFSNEKLVREVLRVGVDVGTREWVSWTSEWKELVKRDRVEEVVRELMGKGEEAEGRRQRVKEIAKKARKAVEEGGTSYADVDALIQELKDRRGLAKTTAH